MELMYKNAAIVAIAVVIIAIALLFLLVKKKGSTYKTGIKAANTARIRNTQFYKMLETKYKVLSGVLAAGLIVSILASIFLSARPFTTSEVKSGVKKRDILLCLDVSFSLYDLNYEITDYLKEVVKGLEGDRIGINIFNTSTVTYVPLTDDYDYVLLKLDELSKYFEDQKLYYEKYIDLYDIPEEDQEEYEDLVLRLEYFGAGTTYNSSSKGSSLVGEGLGTALYTFPYIGESDRTRVIIMCTDNEVNAYKSQIMDLNEAADACSSYGVTVYGIFPSYEKFYEPEYYDYEDCKKGFQSAVESTGGKFYVRTQDQSVSDIVQNIQSHEAMMVQTVVTSHAVDLPEVPYIIMIICLGLALAAGLVLQR